MGAPRPIAPDGRGADREAPVGAAAARDAGGARQRHRRRAHARLPHARLDARRRLPAAHGLHVDPGARHRRGARRCGERRDPAARGFAGDARRSVQSTPARGPAVRRRHPHRRRQRGGEPAHVAAPGERRRGAPHLSGVVRRCRGDAAGPAPGAGRRARPVSPAPRQWGRAPAPHDGAPRHRAERVLRLGCRAVRRGDDAARCARPRARRRRPDTFRAHRPARDPPDERPRRAARSRTRGAAGRGDDRARRGQRSARRSAAATRRDRVSTRVSQLRHSLRAAEWATTTRRSPPASCT